MDAVAIVGGQECLTGLGAALEQEQRWSPRAGAEVELRELTALTSSQRYLGLTFPSISLK